MTNWLSFVRFPPIWQLIGRAVVLLLQLIFKLFPVFPFTKEHLPSLFISKYFEALVIYVGLNQANVKRQGLQYCSDSASEQVETSDINHSDRFVSALSLRHRFVITINNVSEGWFTLQDSVKICLTIIMSARFGWQ